MFGRSPTRRLGPYRLGRDQKAELDHEEEGSDRMATRVGRRVGGEERKLEAGGKAKMRRERGWRDIT